ncbi:MAG: hypothetical protein L6N96_00605 [Candidatus Methylarchaceae archaeon HK02M2]|nr:hypothetical protein [Candidatus Methylarchaceae archaeon HK02M2]
MNLFKSLSKDENDGLKIKVSSAIRKIEVRRRNINNVKYRLRNRIKRLLELRKMESEYKNDTKINLYETEYLNLDNLIRIVDACELALIQIMIRLEIFRDLNEVVYNLSSTLKIMKEVGKSIFGILPSFESFFNDFNSTFNETYGKLQNLSPRLSIDLITEEGEELIEDAIKYVEKKVLKDETLESIISNKDNIVIEKPKKVAMLITGEAVDESSCLSPINSKINRAIVDYISEHKGNLNMLEALDEVDH